MQTVFWTGEIPANPLPIHIYKNDGRDADISQYHIINVKMLDSENDEIDLSGGTIVRTSTATGRIDFVWPQDRSVFETPGDYVMQVELSNGLNIDKTSEWTFKVKELGGGD